MCVFVGDGVAADSCSACYSTMSILLYIEVRGAYLFIIKFFTLYVVLLPLDDDVPTTLP